MELIIPKDEDSMEESYKDKIKDTNRFDSKIEKAEEKVGDVIHGVPEVRPMRDIKVCKDCDNMVWYKIKKDGEISDNYKCYGCGWSGIPITRKAKRPPIRKKSFIEHTDLIKRETLIKKLKDFDSKSLIYLKKGEDKKGYFKPKTILKYKAMICMLYLTASRVRELVGVLDRDNSPISERGSLITEKRKWKYEPLAKHQISFINKERNVIREDKDIIETKEFMKIENIPVLKRKLGTYEKDGVLKERKIFRNVLINVEKERYFVDCIKDYLRILDDHEYLFDMQRQTAWVVSNMFGISKENFAFNHYWRHLRLTHLANVYGFNDTALRQYVAWASSKMAARYVRGMSDDDMANKMW